MTDNKQYPAVTECVRAAGGRVHSDGNIFFKNADAFIAASNAMRAAQPDKWIFDPHDIEQGMMINPEWLKIHGGTAKASAQPETATLPGPSDYQGRSRAAYLSGYEDALSDAGVSVLPVGALAAPTTQAPRSKEAEWIAASSELNCPACGGSGHIEDVKPVEPAVSQGEPQFDLSTSKGGRGYVAWFFGNRLLPRPRHDFDDYCKNVLAADFACVLARHLAAQPQEAAPSQDAEQGNVAALRSALGAMMTQFGMDEDEFSKPTFDQARRALAMEAPANTDVMDAAFEAVRRVFCRLPRHSFIIGPGGGVRKVQDSCGLWVDFDSVHALFDPVAVDAARTQAKESGS